jgi:hypothetical protein
MQPASNWKIASSTPLIPPSGQEPTILRSHSPSPSNFRPMPSQVVHGGKQIAFTHEHAYPPAQHPHPSAGKPLFLHQRMRTQASPIVYFQSPPSQREPPIRLKRNEGHLFAHSPNMVSRVVSPQPQVRNSPSPLARNFPPTHSFQKLAFPSQQRAHYPLMGGSPVLVGESLKPRQLQQRQPQPSQMQSNEYELQVREKREVRPP